MSIESVYNLLEKETNGVFLEGKQVKLTTEQMEKQLKINTQTLHRNLTAVKKYKGIQTERKRTRLLRAGKKYTYIRSLWWYEDLRSK